VARRSDTERWLEVVGQASLKGECIVVEAREVALTNPGPPASPL
jgi:hypothetical protein